MGRCSSLFRAKAGRGVSVRACQGPARRSSVPRPLNPQSELKQHHRHHLMRFLPRPADPAVQGTPRLVGFLPRLATPPRGIPKGRASAFCARGQLKMGHGHLHHACKSVIVLSGKMGESNSRHQTRHLKAGDAEIAFWGGKKDKDSKRK